MWWQQSGIVRFSWGKQELTEAGCSPQPMPGFQEKLELYLQGQKIAWDFPLDIRSGTAFQKKVWQVLKDIPYGQTKTYQEVAKLCGNAKAARAVGHACGQNPVMLLIPCHRVIGSDGKLTGFSAGLSLKEKLLKMEKAMPAQS